MATEELRQLIENIKDLKRSLYWIKNEMGSYDFYEISSSYFSDLERSIKTLSHYSEISDLEETGAVLGATTKAKVSFVLPEKLRRLDLGNLKNACMTITTNASKIEEVAKRIYYEKAPPISSVTKNKVSDLIRGYKGIEKTRENVTQLGDILHALKTQIPDIGWEVEFHFAERCLKDTLATPLVPYDAFGHFLNELGAVIGIVESRIKVEEEKMRVEIPEIPTEPPTKLPLIDIPLGNAIVSTRDSATNDPWKITRRNLKNLKRILHEGNFEEALNILKVKNPENPDQKISIDELYEKRYVDDRRQLEERDVLILIGMLDRIEDTPVIRKKIEEDKIFYRAKIQG